MIDSNFIKNSKFIAQYVSRETLDELNKYSLSILKKNKDIRENIIKIRKNIPKLERKLQAESNFYEGWVMLARSYSIVDNLS